MRVSFTIVKAALGAPSRERDSSDETVTEPFHQCRVKITINNFNGVAGNDSFQRSLA